MKDIVIVVDDSEMIRNIMVKALEDEYIVIQAKDGKEAVNEISKNKSIFLEF